MPKVDEPERDLQATESVASFNVREVLAANDVLLRDKILGTGTYSKVLVGYYAKLDTTVAIKRIDKRQRSEYVKRFLPRELKLVENLKHPSIIRVHEIIETPEYVCLIEEFASNGDLLHLVKSRTRIDENEGRMMFRQLVEGLKYLEMKKVVHRDLKCENLFLDAYFNLKIGDFGFARYMLPGEMSNTYCGSRAYVALEIMQSTEYSDNSIDIWSAGVVLYIMLSGVMPFDDRKPDEMVKMQRQHKIRFPRGIPSDSARRLIMHMLHPDPNKRATLEKIINSEWLGKTEYINFGPMKQEDDNFGCTTADSGCSTASQISETDLRKLRQHMG